MLLGFQQFYLHGKAYPNRPLAPPGDGRFRSPSLCAQAGRALLERLADEADKSGGAIASERAARREARVKSK